MMFTTIVSIYTKFLSPGGWWGPFSTLKTLALCLILRCLETHKNHFSSRHVGATVSPRFNRVREKKRFHCDVGGVLWKRQEEDGGGQGEAGHASFGRLRSVWLQEKLTETWTLWYLHYTLIYQNPHQVLERTTYVTICTQSIAANANY